MGIKTEAANETKVIDEGKWRGEIDNLPKKENKNMFLLKKYGHLESSVY